MSSPVRSFKAVGATPIFIERGKGPYVWSVEGRRYVDYVCSWGPLIAGHSQPRVIAAAASALRRGASFGAPTENELKLAEKVCAHMPTIEKVRFVSSGTEATMSAVRVARASTKRDKVLKFEGCYHGHADLFLSEAGSGLATFDVPSSAGVPESVVAETVTVAYNDVGALKEAFASHRGEFAAVIVEPVAGNMGVVPPKEGFLEEARELCDSDGALLVFDEVITGFRVAMGGAQERLRVRPDITCLGKIIGGGLPVGAYGGRRDLMSMVSPEGPVYQAGTLSGNPVACAAGHATISLMERPGSYELLDSRAARLEEGIREAAEAASVPLATNRMGSMLGLFFTSGEVADLQGAKRSDTALYASFHRGMLDEGIYLPPSPFETLFVSTAHTQRDVDKTVAAAGRVLSELGERRSR